VMRYYFGALPVAPEDVSCYDMFCNKEIEKKTGDGKASVDRLPFLDRVDFCARVPAPARHVSYVLP